MLFHYAGHMEWQRGCACEERRERQGLLGPGAAATALANRLFAPSRSFPDSGFFSQKSLDALGDECARLSAYPCMAR